MEFLSWLQQLKSSRLILRLVTFKAELLKVGLGWGGGGGLIAILFIYPVGFGIGSHHHLQFTFLCFSYVFLYCWLELFKLPLAPFLSVVPVYINSKCSTGNTNWRIPKYFIWRVSVCFLRLYLHFFNDGFKYWQFKNNLRDFHHIICLSIYKKKIL